MKKISFSEKYGLHDAVLSGQKTMTRRISTKPLYRVGEVVAVAQRYKDAGVMFIPEEDEEFGCHNFPAEQTYGWTNKMYVRARLENLQEITDDECINELELEHVSVEMNMGKYQTKWVYQMLWEDKLGNTKVYYHESPRVVFETMIDKILGKGTWERNPKVWVYDFQLIK